VAHVQRDRRELAGALADEWLLAERFVVGRRLTIRPIVLQSIRSIRVIVVLSVRVAGHA
jgi:hypothetical protein